MTARWTTMVTKSIEWCIEDQAYLRSYDMALRPPLPPSPVSKLNRRHRNTEKETTVWWESVGGTKSYDREKAWSCINHLILFSYKYFQLPFCLVQAANSAIWGRVSAGQQQEWADVNPLAVSCTMQPASHEPAIPSTLPLRPFWFRLRGRVVTSVPDPYGFGPLGLGSGSVIICTDPEASINKKKKLR